MNFPQYKNLKLGKEEPKKITDEDVNNELNKMLANPQFFIEKEGESKQGDVTNIDFEGFLDGTPFEGGKGEHYDLELGSHSFIPGFEEQLIGHKKGDDVEVKVTFPENYGAPNLAGKEAIFKCKIHKVSSKPNLDDEFAKKLNFENVEKLRNAMKSDLEIKAKVDADNDYVSKLFQHLADNFELDLEEEKINKRVDEMLNYYSQAMAQYGTDLDNYLKMVGQTKDDFKAKLRKEAIKSLKIDVIFDEIVKKEHLEVTSNDIDEILANYQKAYKLTDEQIKNFRETRLESIKQDILSKKVNSFLASNNH